MFRVFLLEDDLRLAGVVAEFLELRDIEVVHAASLAEARQQYDPGLFDVVLCDYELPDGTGVEFLSEVDLDEAAAILWSGLNRSREALGLDVRCETKDRMPEVLDSLIAMRDEAA